MRSIRSSSSTAISLPSPLTGKSRLTVSCVNETRAALYMDFDNFLGGLIATDPTSAVEVDRPARVSSS